MCMCVCNLHSHTHMENTVLMMAVPRTDVNLGAFSPKYVYMLDVFNSYHEFDKFITEKKSATAASAPHVPSTKSRLALTPTYTQESCFPQVLHLVPVQCVCNCNHNAGTGTDVTGAVLEIREVQTSFMGVRTSVRTFDEARSL